MNKKEAEEELDKEELDRRVEQVLEYLRGLPTKKGKIEDWGP